MALLRQGDKVICQLPNGSSSSFTVGMSGTTLQLNMFVDSCRSQGGIIRTVRGYAQKSGNITRSSNMSGSMDCSEVSNANLVDDIFSNASGVPDVSKLNRSQPSGQSATDWESVAAAAAAAASAFKRDPNKVAEKRDLKGVCGAKPTFLSKKSKKQAYDKCVTKYNADKIAGEQQAQREYLAQVNQANNPPQQNYSNQPATSYKSSPSNNTQKKGLSTGSIVALSIGGAVAVVTTVILVRKFFFK